MGYTGEPKSDAEIKARAMETTDIIRRIEKIKAQGNKHADNPQIWGAAQCALAPLERELARRQKQLVDERLTPEEKIDLQKERMKVDEEFEQKRRQFAQQRLQRASMKAKKGRGTAHHESQKNRTAS